MQNVENTIVKRKYTRKSKIVVEQPDVKDEIPTPDIETPNTGETNVADVSNPVEESKTPELIFPESNWDNVNVGDIIQILIDDNIIGQSSIEPDSYELQPIIVVKQKTYSQANRRAQQKYREKYPEKYCELQKKLYDEKKKDDDWKKKFNERSKKNNEIYRHKKKKELLEQGVEIKPRGRPRKVKVEENGVSEDTETTSSNIVVFEENINYLV